jgi:hypothetical protein
MATLQGIPPAGVTTNMAGPGPGQSPSVVIRQVTLTAAMAIGDVILGPDLQTGAIVYSCLKVNGPAGNIGTTSNPSAFNTAPFTPYVVTVKEKAQFVATAAGGAAGDVVTLITHYLPRNT